MIKLIDTVKEVDKRLMEEKNERNSYTFSDTEHFAINLLFDIDGDKIVKKDLANRLSDEFEEILVDEYQDTNEAQDLLFTYLSNGHNLFTVGDIKSKAFIALGLQCLIFLMIKENAMRFMMKKTVI